MIRLMYTTLLCVLSIFSLAQPGNIDSLRRLATHEKSDTGKAKFYYRICSAFIDMGNGDSANRYALLSKQFSSNANFLKGLAVSCNFLGQIKNYTGFQDSAVYYFQASKKYYEELGDTSRAAGLLNNLGIVYRQKGDYIGALSCYFQSLKTKEHFHDSIGIGNSYHNIAQAYGESGDTVNSIKYHRRALEIRRKIGDFSGIGASLVPIALYYKNNRRYEEAINNLEEALKIAVELQEEESIAIATYNLGSVYYDQGQLTNAMTQFEQSLAISRKNGNVLGVAVCLESIADVMRDKKDVKAAIAYLDEAYVLSQKAGAIEVTGSIAEKLAALYETTGETKKALQFFKIFHNLHDSIFNEENIRKLTSENLKYEQEKVALIEKTDREKREALMREEAFRKNLLIIVTLLFLLVVSFFSYKLYRRLKENKHQKLIIEVQQKEMIASINYAKRIQYALLAHSELLHNNLPEHFVLFKPKDIVSGDFYWATVKNNFFYLAVCDCTGHGVPGAFMSLLNINYLNEAINEKGIVEPGEILNHVRRQLIKNLSGGRDGMDAVLLRLPLRRSDKIQFAYAAANNSGILVSDGGVEELVKDKMPIGLGVKEDSFRTFIKEVNKGDCLYLYTDGFADQFGGQRGKKFKYKQLDELLRLNSHESFQAQQQLLLSAFDSWKGKLEQVDDVCVVGIRF